MKLLLAILLISLFPSGASAQNQKEGVAYSAKIIRVIDGDTVVFAAPFLPDPLKKELSLRVFGVDTPERGSRAKCQSEDLLGKAATKFTKDSISKSKNLKIVLMGWDKYGGRVLGDVIIDGNSLRMSLIDGGYAREYYGEKKTSWCN